MASYKQYAQARNAVYGSMMLDDEYYEPDHFGLSEYEEEVYKHKQVLFDAQKKADKEENRLWKRMIRSGASYVDRQKLIDKAEKTVANENWQPLDFRIVVVTPTHTDIDTYRIAALEFTLGKDETGEI